MADWLARRAAKRSSSKHQEWQPDQLSPASHKKLLGLAHQLSFYGNRLRKHLTGYKPHHLDQDTPASDLRRVAKLAAELLSLNEDILYELDGGTPPPSHPAALKSPPSPGSTSQK